VKLIAFCEAAGDFLLLSGLVDRVLRDSGPAWVVDLLETPDAVRTWQPDGFGRMHFDLHRLDGYVDRLKVRVPHGHFDGRPGGAGALMARTVFWIVRALHKQAPDEPIEAVVLVWDVDVRSEGRSSGVAAARDEARRWAPFRIICGFPDPEREAWVLAGFEPCDEDERARLDELQRELGFSPVLHAVRLRAKQEGHLRDGKRVLRELTRGDHDREARCWAEPVLETLRARGADTGLAAFLDEIEEILVPLLGR
jgi:hypothetical protein